MSGLGRLYAPDDRDALYPMRAIVAAPPAARRWRHWWTNAWWGDQGDTPQCVAYAWTHWLEDGPVTHAGPAPLLDPAGLYREAQLIDEWPGEGYDGTSVRAGAKVLQQQGLISEYRWAFAIADVIDALLSYGPVVVGTTWYESMFEPDRLGNMRVDPASGIAGGHAYMLTGINLDTGYAVVKNSWGRSWGRRGRAAMRLEDLVLLLADEGEACIAVERPDPA